MKKFTLLCCLVLALSLLAGCAGTPVIYYTECTCPVGSHEAVQTPASPAATEAPAAAEAPAAEGALKTGLALVTGISDSKDATAGEAGEGKYDVTMVAVLVDDNGVISGLF